MLILDLTLLFVIFHFGFYLALGRNLLFLKTERGIFLYHFLSFCFVGIIGTIVILLLSIDNFLCLILGVLSLHGIYSLSFLELWSLAQGGYSVSVLRMAPIIMKDDVAAVELNLLEKIGDDKFKGRLLATIKLGLLQQQRGMVTVTWPGAVVGTVLLMLAKLTNIKDRG